MVQLVQPHFESAQAVAERLASTPEPLRCRWCSDVVGRERHAVAQLATGGSCIDARPTPVGMPWPLHPLGLACVEAVSAAVDSPVTSSAPPRMWCMRRMRMVRISRPSLLLLWLEQQRIRTEAIDADTTISVSIGARSGGIRWCSWFSRISSRRRR